MSTEFWAAVAIGAVTNAALFGTLLSMHGAEIKRLRDRVHQLANDVHVLMGKMNGKHK